MRTILSAAALVAAFSCPAFARASCGPSDAVLAALERDHRERPRFARTDAEGNVVAVTVSPAGTWTIVAAPPALGLSCIVAHGRSGRVLFAAGPGKFGI